MYTEESQAVEVERHTHLQYAIFKNQLGLQIINCSMLQLVVCSRGSGCGFVVVAVLCPFFCFLFHFLSAISGQAGYCWLHGHGQWSSPALALKAGHYVFGHLRCHVLSTVMPFELLLYHKLIFAFFGFAVWSGCQNHSLFLCIVNEINNKKHAQDSYKSILNLLLQQFSVHPEGKGGLSVTFALFPD